MKYNKRVMSFYILTHRFFLSSSRVWMNRFQFTMFPYVFWCQNWSILYAGSRKRDFIPTQCNKLMNFVDMHLYSLKYTFCSNLFTIAIIITIATENKASISIHYYRFKLKASHFILRINFQFIFKTSVENVFCNF